MRRLDGQAALGDCRTGEAPEEAGAWPEGRGGLQGPDEALGRTACDLHSALFTGIVKLLLGQKSTYPGVVVGFSDGLGSFPPGPTAGHEPGLSSVVLALIFLLRSQQDDTP